jgi:hypothetical protein
MPPLRGGKDQKETWAALAMEQEALERPDRASGVLKAESRPSAYFGECLLLRGKPPLLRPQRSGMLVTDWFDCKFV